jgi:hypothetical protein
MHGLTCEKHGISFDLTAGAFFSCMDLIVQMQAILDMNADPCASPSGVERC